MTTKNRLYNIDILKLICAFLVVCIHAPFPGKVGNYVIAIARVAVPIFLIITGFFIKPHLIKKQIRKVFNLLLFSNLLYFIFDLCKYTINGNLNTFLKSIVSIKTFAKFVFFNDSPFGIHLWYLGAILYVLVLFFYINKIFNFTMAKNIFYFATPFLLITDLILGKYSLLLFNKEFSYIFIRNFIFVGIPYFSIGMFIKEHYENIKKISNLKVIALIIIFSMLTIFERTILLKYELNAARDHYISTTFLSISLFVFFLNNNFTISKFKDSISKLPTHIYIIHPIVAYIYIVFAKKLFHTNIYLYTYPIIVFIITTIIVSLNVKIIKNIKAKLKILRN